MVLTQQDAEDKEEIQELKFPYHYGSYATYNTY